MPPETEYKKGCRRPNHHNSVRGVLPPRGGYFFDSYARTALNSIPRSLILNSHNESPTISVNPSTVQHSTMIATRAYFVSMSCLPAKKRLTFELFGFERKPQRRLIYPAIFTLRVIHIPFSSQRNAFLLPPCRVPIYGLYGYLLPINILHPIMGDISGHVFAGTDISSDYPSQ